MAKKPVKKAKAAKPAKKAAPAPKKAVKAAPKAAPKAAAKAAAPAIVKAKSASRPKNTATNSYTYGEFIENVRGFLGLPKRSQAKEIVEDLATFIRDSLRRGYKLPLLGLGKLYVRESKARQARNPQTGAIVNVPARKRVRFTASKALKEAVLK